MSPWEFGTTDTSGCNFGVDTVWNPAAETIPVVNVPSEGELFISVFTLNTAMVMNKILAFFKGQKAGRGEVEE